MQLRLIAYSVGQPCGLIHGSIDPAQREVAHFGAMWVDPGVRGHGVGRALLEAVTRWAKAREVRRLELWVTEKNEAAIRLYEHAGFQDTGKRSTLPSNPTLQIHQMARDL